jgi:hypothetical protein
MHTSHHITKLLADQRATKLEREAARRGCSPSEPKLALLPARALRRLQTLAAAKAAYR